MFQTEASLSQNTRQFWKNFWNSRKQDKLNDLLSEAIRLNTIGILPMPYHTHDEQEAWLRKKFDKRRKRFAAIKKEAAAICASMGADAPPDPVAEYALQLKEAARGRNAQRKPISGGGGGPSQYPEAVREIDGGPNPLYGRQPKIYSSI